MTVQMSHVKMKTSTATVSGNGSNQDTWQAHRNGDPRYCEAGTIVTQQTTVFVDNKLWAVYDDANAHSAGNLRPELSPNVYIENKRVAVKDDPAIVDGALHPVTEVNAGKGSSSTVWSGPA